MAVTTDLTGRTAIVTGAGRGIGRAIALVLARAGAAVACASRTAGEAAAAAADIRALGVPALAIPTDVTSRESVERLVETVLATWGQVDILVNNAGTNARCPALDVTDAQFDQVMATNLKGAFLCCQAVGRHMVARGRGRIVNIASMLGLVATETTAAYGASKAALIHLTRILALEWAPHGVQVNAVAPGGVHTALTDHLIRNPEFTRRFLSRTPMGRYGTPDEIAAICLFLCSDAASYVTGAVLTADGGYTLS